MADLYLYETHMHTSQASRCGVATGAAHARFYAAHGYRGVIVTDHFLGGNTAVDRGAPWPELVRQFCAGYEETKAEGQKLGLDVFFGWEQTFQGDDYLVYGLGPDWLLQHPEVRHWTRADQLRETHRFGGCVVQAHPFRQRDYLSRILLGLRFADAVEIANGGNEQLDDACARRYAAENGCVVTAGSDNHHSLETTPLFGVALEKPLEDIGGYVRLLRSGVSPRLIVPPDRFTFPPGERVYLPCFMLDESERPVPYSLFRP